MIPQKKIVIQSQQCQTYVQNITKPMLQRRGASFAGTSQMHALSDELIDIIIFYAYVR